MLLELTVRDRAGCDRDIVIRADGRTTLRAVLAELAPLVPDASDGLWVGSTRLMNDDQLGALGLLRGDIVTAGCGSGPDRTAEPLLRLHVVGGPSAGRTVALRPGETIIGRCGGCDLVLTDPKLSRRHLAITVTRSGVTFRDLGSANGVALDGRPATTGSLPLGAHLRIGESTLCLAQDSDPVVATRTSSQGRELLSRSAPIFAVPVAGGVFSPEPLAERGTSRGIMTALVPAVGGAAMAYVTRQPLFLIMAVAGPAALLGERLLGAWGRRRRRQSRRAGRAAAAIELAHRLGAEVTQRRYAHPDPAQLLRAATMRADPSWTRRRGGDDFLDLRVGLADQPSYLRVSGGLVDRLKTSSAGAVASVPVAVNLRVGALAICGPQSISRSVARWLISQLAALHSPADLEIALVLAPDTASAWTWARWLPQLRSPVADTVELGAALVHDLLEEVARRAAELTSTDRPWSGPSIVLLFDETLGIAGLLRLLETGPAVGITAICLSGDRSERPATVNTTIWIGGDVGSQLTVEYGGGREPLQCLADQVDLAWADALSRALAPKRDTDNDLSRSIPAVCSLLGVNSMPIPTADLIGERWRHGGQPHAVLGAAARAPFSVDLEHDGPHILIAGTTGAGKSELLRSLVTGLALNCSPADLAFILIDYKGGAAFSECADLPHTTGLVTDLDARLTERVLRSLRAELRRREEKFADAGTTSLNGYRAGPQQLTSPLGRLVIIVDEFAALADELPQLLSGLVAIAARGRSLGMHLVLATQRPAGIISAEIQANMSLRIALRMIDPGDSESVVASPKAARIGRTQPGRAFARAGAELIEFQTGRIGGLTTEPDHLRVDGLGRWGQLPPEPQPPVGAVTDLVRLVEAMRAASITLGTLAPPSPWLPPLPALITLGQLAQTAEPSTVAVGLVDEPDEQRQSPLTIDPAMGGSTLIAGPARSGRTSALCAIAGAAATNRSPERLQIYLIDCAGGGLARLADLPHCGATASRDDPETVARLVERLTVEVARRRTDRPADGPDDGAFPALLLLLDDWENFARSCDDYDAGATTDAVTRLLREAPAVGLTVAITGGRASLTNRIANQVAQTFALGPPTWADPLPASVGRRPGNGRPGSIDAVATPPGRGIRLMDGSDVQFAVLGDDGSRDGQWSAIRDLAIEWTRRRPRSARHQQRAPIFLRALPGSIRHDEIDPPRPLRPTEIVLGVGGDAADPVVVDLFAGAARWLIAGPPRSGRSTLLSSVLRQLHTARLNLLVAAPRGSPLAKYATDLGVDLLRPDSTAAQLPAARPQVVLIDDGPAFATAPAGAVLAELADSTNAESDHIAIVLAGRPGDLAVSYHGIVASVRHARTGILLQPGAGDGELLGVSLPRTRSIVPPGRGVLVADQPQLERLSAGRAALPIQVAI